MSKKTKLFKKSTKGTPKKTSKTEVDGPGKGHLRNLERLDRKKLKGASEVAVRFAALIHGERQKRKLTVREMAKSLNMHNSYFNRIEVAGCEPKLGTALGLMKKLKLPLSSLDSVFAAV